ncbi:WSC domain-containing protein [Xylaria digitata]|nr:WSC domain-containing protein [Xylaria digitata]
MTFTMLRQIPLTLLSLLLLLTPILPCATAQPFPNTTAPSNSSSSSSSSASSSSPGPLKIRDGSGSNYSYIGCWNETFGLVETTGLRALQGSNEVLPEVMTVERCLDFCAHGAYLLAGLEYSRECWCADELNPLSVQLPDNWCDTPCDGANMTACGGALRLSLYNSTIARREKNGAGNRREGAWSGVVLGTAVLVLGFALWS